jgi:hypothetical protein
MLSYLVCYKCWKKFVASPPVQEVGEVYKDGTGFTLWRCSALPVYRDNISEMSDIPAGCFCKFEQAVADGIYRKGGDA